MLIKDKNAALYFIAPGDLLTIEDGNIRVDNRGLDYSHELETEGFSIDCMGLIERAYLYGIKIVDFNNIDEKGIK